MSSISSSAASAVGAHTSWRGGQSIVGTRKSGPSLSPHCPVAANGGRRTHQKQGGLRSAQRGVLSRANAVYLAWQGLSQTSKRAQVARPGAKSGCASCQPRATAGGAAPEGDGEKTWSIDEILAEAEAEGANLVFSELDDSEDEEDFMKAPAIRVSSNESTAELPSTSDMTQILSAYNDAEAESIQEITVQELEAKRQGAASCLLLDVRSEEEYNSGHVPGAVLLPLESLIGRISAGEVNIEDKALAVICRSGRRSARAVLELKTFCQAKDVVNVKGGTLAWIEAGYPVEKH